MVEVDMKLKWLHALVVDQWKSGKAAELRLFCENGQLKVSLSADFGRAKPSWNAATAGVPDDASVRGSPSRLRRRLRRAAERAATEKTNSEQSVAEKAATEEVVAEKESPEQVDTEKEAAEKAFSEKNAAEKADAEREAAEKADAERDAAETAFDEKEAAEKSDAEKAAAKKAAAEKELAVKGAAEASTSSCGSAGRRATAVNSPVGVAVGSKRPPSKKRLCDNAGKSELAGEILPLPLSPRTVKCHVCVCLGRETSLVPVGSRCPSCWITATDS